MDNTNTPLGFYGMAYWGFGVGIKSMKAGIKGMGGGMMITFFLGV